jgi:hypothetical protein
MKVDFWNNISQQTQINCIFNRILYADHTKKETELPYIKKIIDQLSAEELSQPITPNLQKNNTYYQKYIDSFYLGSNTYRFLSVESYMKKNEKKQEKELGFKNYRKPKNILEASIYHPEVFHYIISSKNIGEAEEKFFLNHINHLKNTKLYDGFKTHFKMNEIEKLCNKIVLQHKTKQTDQKIQKRKIL